MDPVTAIVAGVAGLDPSGVKQTPASRPISTTIRCGGSSCSAWSRRNWDLRGRRCLGKLTVGGPLQPFKAGAGLVAVEGGTPIVLVKIHPHDVLDRPAGWPSPLRGDVELVLGEPLWFDADTDHAAATTRLEAAVAAL